MAKTRQSTRNTKLELNNILTIEGQEYNINAVHSDAAAKTDQALTIKKQIKDSNNNITSEDVVFNGSEVGEVSVVPADSGGHFNSPITVRSHEAGLKELTSESVINYSEAIKLVEQLTGSGWFTWDGKRFNGVLNNDNVPQRMGVVVGKSSDINNFASVNYTEKYLPLYLYLCSDETNGDNGNIYLGNNKSASYTQLATIAKKINGPIPEDTTEITDDNNLIFLHKDANETNGSLSYKPASKIWDYIKNNISKNTNTLLDVCIPLRFNKTIWIDSSQAGMSSILLNNSSIAGINALNFSNKDGDSNIAYRLQPNYQNNELTFYNGQTYNGQKHHTIYHSGNIVQVNNGGTGATTTKEAQNKLLGGMVSVTKKAVTNSQLVFRYEDESKREENGTLFYRSPKTLIPYIGNQLGFSFSNKSIYNEDTNIAEDTDFGSIVLSVNNGGTGNTTNTLNAVLLGNNSSAIKSIASKTGAFYSKNTGGEPCFGTLPIEYGGTGATTAKKAQNKLLDMMPEVTDDKKIVVTDSQLVFRYEDGSKREENGTLFYRKVGTLWNYITGQIRSNFGFTDSNILSVKNGGTGATTAKEAQNKLLTGMGSSTSKAVTNSQLVFRYENPNSNSGTLFYRSPKTLVPYIGSQLGFTFSNLNDDTSEYDSVVLSVAKGGTGATSLKNITVGNATNATNATNDSNNKKITTGYYHVRNDTNAVNDDAENSITISKTDPTTWETQGKGTRYNGDIWIVYS